MSQYEISFTDGTKSPIIIQEESHNISTDITLFGRRKIQYGQAMNQNMLSLLENFACPENPANPGTPDLNRSKGKLSRPVVGQFWYNSTQKIPYIWDGSRWNSLLSQGSIASNWGVITNGQQIPQPISDDGYVFSYNECVWIVGPFTIDGQLTEYTVETSENAVVTATSNLGDLVCNYLIVGIKGNINQGSLSPVITPTPTPTRSVTPTPTSQAINLANGLISFWEFEENGTDPYFLDAVGTNNFTRIGGNALTLPAGPPFDASHGKVGKAIASPSASGVYFESNPTLGMSAGDNASYAFGGWFRLDSNFTSYSNLFQRGNFGIAGQRSFTLTYTLGTDNLTLYKSNDGSAYEYLNTPANIGLDDFGWHFIAAWVDGNAMTLNIQVDNGPVYTSSFLFNRTYDIGTLKLGSSSGIPLQSGVDQLFYYNRVLNVAERAALWNSGLGVSSAFAAGLLTPTPTRTLTPTPTPSSTANVEPLSVGFGGTYSVSGECSRINPGICNAVTQSTYVSVTGGVSPYTYQWLFVSGSYRDETNINSPSAYSTNFTRSIQASYNDGDTPAPVVSGNYRCRVTDAIGNIAYSPILVVYTRHEFTAAALSVSASPPTGVTGSCSSGWPDNSHSCQAVSSVATAQPTGGSGVYTYNWTYISGAQFIIMSPDTQSTQFRLSQVATNQSLVGTYRCTVDDGYNTAYVDIDVTLSFGNTL